MKFTVLLATLNRPQQLRRCVESILGQTMRDFELLIVDQSDPELCDPSIAETDSEKRVRFMHISQRGLSHARNEGLKYASGDYVFLADDDALYPPSTFAAASSFIERYKPVILGGSLCDPERGIQKSGGKSTVKIGFSDAFKYHCSATMAIEREFLASQGGFDERFGIGAKFGAAEETDLIFAALREKLPIFYTDSYTVIHEIVELKDDYRNKERMYKYGYGTGGLLKKTVLHYSAFYGVYHLLRIVCGNLLLGTLRLNRAEGINRLNRAMGVLRGFRDYSEP